MCSAINVCLKRQRPFYEKKRSVYFCSHSKFNVIGEIIQVCTSDVADIATYRHFSEL